MVDEVRKGAFVIRKIHSAYLVSIVKPVVFVKPLHGTQDIACNIITASTMQMVSNSKLLVHKPKDLCRFLIDYFTYLGWTIEVAD